MRTHDKGQDECDWQDEVDATKVGGRLEYDDKITSQRRIPNIPIYANSRRTPQYLVHIPHELSDNGQRIASKGNEEMMTSARCVMGLAQSPAYTWSPDQGSTGNNRPHLLRTSRFLTTTRATLT